MLFRSEGETARRLIGEAEAARSTARERVEIVTPLRIDLPPSGLSSSRELLRIEDAVIARGDRRIGPLSLTIRGPEPESLAADISRQFGVSVRQLGGELRIDAQTNHSLLGRVLDAFGPRIEAVSLARPTLEDVFVARTGHRFWNE